MRNLETIIDLSFLGSHNVLKGQYWGEKFFLKSDRLAFPSYPGPKKNECCNWKKAEAVLITEDRILDLNGRISSLKFLKIDDTENLILIKIRSMTQI